MSVVFNVIILCRISPFVFAKHFFIDIHTNIVSSKNHLVTLSTNSAIKCAYLCNAHSACCASELNNTCSLYFVSPSIETGPFSGIRFLVPFKKFGKINYILWDSRPKVRDTTLSNHWNVCIRHFTPISCKHQSNLAWFHSISNWKLDRLLWNWNWFKNITDFKSYVPYLRSISLRVIRFSKLKFLNEGIFVILLLSDKFDIYHDVSMTLLYVS